MKISVSSMMKYWRCPELYNKIYVTKELERERPSGAMVVGTAAHKAIDVALKAKLAGRIMSADDMQVAAELAFDLESDKIEMNELDRFFGKEAILGESRAVAIRAARAYHKDLLKEVNPIVSELQFSVQWSDDVELVGAIDVVSRETPGLCVRDNKISSNPRTPAKETAEDSIQLAVYCIVVEELMGERCRLAVHDHFVNSKQPHYLTRKTEFSEGRLRAIRLRVDRTIEAIRAGVFPPGEPYLVCNGKKCPVYGTCKMGAGDDTP